jgi:hypothetical protein
MNSGGDLGHYTPLRLPPTPAEETIARLENHLAVHAELFSPEEVRAVRLVQAALERIAQLPPGQRWGSSGKDPAR